MTEHSSPVTELQAVKDAIWQAHKDNFHLRMLDIYPMMAVAAVEAMRVNAAQTAPSGEAREKEITRLATIEECTHRLNGGWHMRRQIPKEALEAFANELHGGGARLYGHGFLQITVWAGKQEWVRIDLYDALAAALSAVPRPDGGGA